MTKVPRLNDTFQPSHYILTLDLTKATDKIFSGSVIITGQVTSDSITLHAKDLVIHSATIDGQAEDRKSVV